VPRLLVGNFSISLDGYGAGPDQSLDHPLGVRGMDLMEWFFQTRVWRRMHAPDDGNAGEAGVDDAVAARGFENIGAWILGRNMFGPVRGPWPDESWKGWWGEEPPYHTPVFVLTHHARAPLAMAGGTEFRFVTQGIHAALEAACASYRPGAYEEYKAWCDRYFYLPHRQEPRGVGGIFFDDLAASASGSEFAFVRAVGEAVLGVYPRIVARRKDTPYDEAARERLLVKRGRYVEFNLVYDRGTRFGFSTDADPDAYLMSLPPLVRW
jgi:dihydrofolate reductase